MKQAAIAAIAIATTFLGASADAQTMPKRKPGLWEAQMTTAGAGANMPNMQDQLAKMPPEQRAQMEAMMKQRGISFGAQGTTMTARFCLSEKDAADESGRALLSGTERDASKCDHKVVSRSASEVRVHAVCATDKGPSEFDVRVYDMTPTSMAMEMNGKSPDRGEVHMQQKARWVSSDCGAVK